MTALELLLRKYHQGWTDTEIIILMKLKEKTCLRLSDFNYDSGIPIPTIHGALCALSQRKLIDKKTVDRNKLYTLTEEGHAALHLLLNTSPPPAKE